VFLAIAEEEESEGTIQRNVVTGEADSGTGKYDRLRRAGKAVGATVARGGNVIGAAGRAIPKGVSGNFKGLPKEVQGTFSRAGLRSWMTRRNMAESTQFFEASVPRFVRNLGKTAEFIKGKQASHIESFKNAPHKVRWDSNLLWERATANVKRGADNIRRWELRSIKARNFVDASGIVAKRMAGGAAKGAIWAAMFEAPVSAIENFIHVRKGRESRVEAAKQVATDSAKAGAAGAAVGGAIVFVVAMGGGTILAPIALPVTAVGLGVYAVSSTLRIRRAINGETEDTTETDAVWVELAFHAECSECESGELCHDAFLRDVAASAS